jgi:hypothetical protein
MELVITLGARPYKTSQLLLFEFLVCVLIPEFTLTQAVTFAFYLEVCAFDNFSLSIKQMIVLLQDQYKANLT